MTAPPAAIYCRVSTDDQAEYGTSLDDQQARARDYCDAHDWPVHDTYVDDGVSGATTQRPELNRLLRDAESNRFSRVVVTDPDRLSRDLVDGLIIERDLAAVGVEIVYLIQPTMGTLERQIRGVIAEEERRKIRDRTSRGLRAVAAAGFWPGGPPPFGYRILRTDDGRSVLEINDSEAGVLTRMIDALVDRRLTTWELAAELNDDNVPTPSAGRSLSNSLSPYWTHRRVRDALSTADGIAGTWLYKTATGTFTIPIPAIVSEQRLQQLRERLAQTSTGRRATTKKHHFLLARRLTSPCGNPMHGYSRPDGTSRVYRCSHSTADRGPERCECSRASADSIEAATWQLIYNELTDSERLQRLAGLAANIPTPEEQGIDDVRTLDRKIKRLETTLGVDIADLLASGADPATVRTATQELDRRLALLRTQRAQALHWAAARADQATHLERVQRLATSAREALTNPTADLQARVVALLDIRVTVTGHHTCPTCDGKGLIANSDDHTEHRRKKTGTICPTCIRFRQIPEIEVHGLLPTTDHLPTTPDADGVPFTLRSIA